MPVAPTQANLAGRPAQDAPLATSQFSDSVELMLREYVQERASPTGPAPRRARAKASRESVVVAAGQPHIFTDEQRAWVAARLARLRRRTPSPLWAQIAWALDLNSDW